MLHVAVAFHTSYSHLASHFRNLLTTEWLTFALCWFLYVPIQCPYNAHTVPIQCPLKKHAVPIHSLMKKASPSPPSFLNVKCMGTVCFLNGHCMGTVWALYGHCMGIGKKRISGQIPANAADPKVSEAIHFLERHFLVFRLATDAPFAWPRTHLHFAQSTTQPILV